MGEKQIWDLPVVDHGKVRGCYIFILPSMLLLERRNDNEYN